ncbi:unnamed protein product [Acanthoscelides obtectus]|uniref:Dynein attachment factor N-terminal domain-containing protein n=1 Tax=Acanthoscelides obtectus TaxID=200917 RepID=A0A9P0KSM7_ACAOB|nr:unnamed protein product [Acanthoscelides obtectus]CAK1657798.1 Coiled-coil domain-containing protein 103 [Acanthoscelides obtectus]
MSNRMNMDLYKELQEKIDGDKMYWIRNDAKIRAVTTSKTYEEFKDYVAAAHLKSLSRQEIMDKKLLAWNKACK